MSWDEVPPMNYDDVPPFDYPADPRGPSTTGPRILPPTDMKLLAEKLEKDLKLRLEFGDDAVAGESVGLKEFDEYLVAEAGRMMVLAGGPGTGKTALALSMARYVATRQCVVDAETGRRETGKVLYVLTEMTDLEMMVRLVQGMAGLTTRQMKKDVTPEVLEKAQKALRILWQSGVILVNAVKSDGDIDDILATMAHAKQVHGDSLRMVFFDNMSMVTHSSRSKHREQHERVAHSAQELKRCAEKHGFPLWVLVHTKRKGGSAQYKPSMEDLAETSKLERIADSVVIITEPLKLGEGDVPLMGTAPFTGVGDPFGAGLAPASAEPEAYDRELYVLKNRGEKAGFVIDLKFVASQMRFEGPDAPTWRPYQVPDAENIRVAQYRAARRELDLF